VKIRTGFGHKNTMRATDPFETLVG
jgi:hypothetical protein